jgi:hypothetical protein
VENQHDNEGRGEQMRRTVIVLLCVLVAIVLMPSSKAWATPAFARSQNAPCTQCHLAFPKLNPYGMVFKQDGYRSDTYEGGMIWDLKSMPLGGVVQASYTYSRMRDYSSGAVSDGTEGISDENQFALDTALFFSGGPLSNRFSYFLDFGIEDQSDWELGSAFLLVNDLLPDAELNVKAGQYDNEFYYLSSPRRLTLEDYLAPVTLDAIGVEVNGSLPIGLQYAVGYGNDNTEWTQLNGKKYDTHPRIGSYYGWLTYSIAKQTIGVLYDSSNFDSTCANLNDATDPPTCISPGYTTQNRTQLDGNLDLWLGPVNAVLGYFWQDGADGEKGRKQNNLLAEVIYAHEISEHSQVVFDARYEYQDSRAEPGIDNIWVLSTSYYPLENLKFIAEYSQLAGKESGVDDTKFQLAATFGF